MKNVLDLPNGAEFRLADFHMHTPIDKRFSCPAGTVTDTPGGRDKFATAYAEAAKNASLSIIAITEHNDVQWINEIREASAKNGITVFPGFELNADSGSGGIHLLCLFEPDRPIDQLDDIITELGLPRGERLHSDGSSKLCKVNLYDAIELVHEKNGVVIAAHVLREHGILKSESMTGEVRVNAWKNKDLLAAEIPKARSSYEEEDSFSSRTLRNENEIYKRERPIACTYSSDARSLDEIGSRPTYIKLSSPSIRGLKQAFLDWESRIRHPDELPKEDYSRIVGVQWTGGFLDGLGLHCNKNLNCIIGGKGTGKSTIIETIRFAFGLEPSARDVKKQFSDIIKNVFQAGSTVRVLIEHHTPTSTHYLVERSTASDPVVYKWDSEKSERGDIIDVRPMDIFPGLEVYGQKEILELANNENTQVELLERFVDADKLAKEQKKESELIDKLKANSDSISDFRSKTESLEEQKQQLASFEEKLSRFKKLGIDKKLAERSKYTTEENMIEHADEIVDSVAGLIESFENNFEIDTGFLDDEKIKALPHQAGFASLRDSLMTLRKSIQSSLADMKSSVKTFEADVSELKSDWNKAFEQQKDKFNETLKELQTDTLDPDEYIRTEKAIGKLKPKVAGGNALSDQMKELINERSKLLTELAETRRNIFQSRKAAETYVNDQLGGLLEVEMAYEGRKNVLVDHLTGLRTGVRREQIERVVGKEDFSCRKLAEAIATGPDKLVSEFNFTATAAQTLCSKLEFDEVASIETFEIPHSISIRLNIGTKSSANYRETDRLSVGQRCTAILMLILLHSRYPLIIDQPEDDLDNSFVYSDIVQRLRIEKERRQFVIATHNANIPVLGDAELIQVLHAERGRLLIDRCIVGSIDDVEIREPVETILEGGREAFEFRQAKYGF